MVPDALQDLVLGLRNGGSSRSTKGQPASTSRELCVPSIYRYPAKCSPLSIRTLEYFMYLHNT
ncbi:hypothetical protein E2C01_000359 [Portunus trituberculatus]|uniref:Uncharacterized protein n=1 Tax=Portunus trituberculatus TaxID=210409 RepID=A0A5B7CDV7_PORTR|nr:hypothetical protein [Portunus trituberculatus]